MVGGIFEGKWIVSWRLRADNHQSMDALRRADAARQRKR